MVTFVPLRTPTETFFYFQILNYFAHTKVVVAWTGQSSFFAPPYTYTKSKEPLFHTIQLITTTPPSCRS
jgi:hypothetical protein